MSIQAIKCKFHAGDAFVLESAKVDDSVMNGLIEGHLKDFQTNGVSKAKPLVLRNCSISAKHLELLQTLSKLPNLCLEDCMVSGLKISATYAHIGKEKDFRPIMSKAVEHGEISREERAKQNVAGVASPVLNAQKALKPHVKRIDYYTLQKFVSDTLKGTDTFNRFGFYKHFIVLLRAAIQHLISVGKERPFELSEKEYKELQAVLYNYLNSKMAHQGQSVAGFRPTLIPIEDAGGAGSLHTIQDLRVYLENLSYSGFRKKIYKDFELDYPV